jgi:hypothetical protein
LRGGLNFNPSSQYANHLVSGSHLINARSGVNRGNEENVLKANGRENPPERRIFCPPASLFVGHSPLRGCSLLTPCGQAKPHAAPSAPIYEMTSRRITEMVFGVAGFVLLVFWIFEYKFVSR